MRRRARVGRLDATWSHLLCDLPGPAGTAELLDFARRLGLNPAWLQKQGTSIEHFDLTEPKRQHALRLGAVAIRYGHEGAALTRAKARGERFDLEAVRRDLARREAQR